MSSQAHFRARFSSEYKGVHGQVMVYQLDLGKTSVRKVLAEFIKSISSAGSSADQHVHSEKRALRWAGAGFVHYNITDNNDASG